MEKKKYEKPVLKGAKVFEVIALACCKAAGCTGGNRNTVCAAVGQAQATLPTTLS